MPRTKSAKKALRVSKKKTVKNDLIKSKFKLVLKKLSKATKEKQPELMSQAFSAVDKAAKSHIIHKNKAARIKKQISAKFKLVKATKISGKQTAAKKTAKKSTTKKVTKK